MRLTAPGRILPALLLSATACVSPPGVDPFRIPKAQFFERTRTVVVLPVSWADGPVVGPAGESLTTEIANAMRAAGLTVVEGLEAARNRESPVDAVVVSTLEVVGAPFRDGYARWDGATERLHGPDGWDSDIVRFEGRLPALTLRVRVRDRSGRICYDHRGGLRLLTRIHAVEFTDVDPETALSDVALVQAAVRLTLKPLLDTSPTARGEPR